MKKLGLIIFVIILSACSSSASATPTPQNKDALLTQVVQTAYAKLTQTKAAMPPTATPTPIPPTATATPEPTFTPTIVPTLPPTVTVRPTLPSTGRPCLRAELVQEDPKDGWATTPGDIFYKKWTFLNIGSCTWTAQYKFIFIDGDRMGAPLLVDLPKEVAPGGALTINLELTAPDTPGSHRGYWKFRANTGELFGVGVEQGAVWVDIVVTGP